MSTRCNIWIDDGNTVQQVYHHHDGYLEGVGSELVTITRMAAMLTGHRYEKVGDDYERIYDGSLLKKNFVNLMTGTSGYEFESNGLHGDIEYLYYVKIDREGVNILYHDDYKFWEDEDKALENFRNGKAKDFEVHIELKPVN